MTDNAQSDSTSGPVVGPLSTRQRQVLGLAAAGMSTLEIAARLELTREDVAEHVVSVMRALGARSKLEAIVRAHHHGLLPFQDA